MKKFVLAVIILAAVGLGFYYLVYFKGFYIPWNRMRRRASVLCQRENRYI